MSDAIQEATKEKAPSQAAVLMPSPAVQAKEKLERDIEKAEAKSAVALQALRDREKARAQAPDGAYVSPILDQDPMEKMARRLVPEAFNDAPKKRGIASKAYDYKPNVEMRTYWDIQEHHKQCVNNGWIPVMDDDGEHACVNELFLYKRDIAFTREAVYDAAKRSEERLNTKDTQVKKAALAGGGAVESDDLVVQKQDIN